MGVVVTVHRRLIGRRIYWNIVRHAKRVIQGRRLYIYCLVCRYFVWRRGRSPFRDVVMWSFVYMIVGRMGNPQRRTFSHMLMAMMMLVYMSKIRFRG